MKSAATLCLLLCLGASEAQASTNTLRPLGSAYNGNGYIEYLPDSYLAGTQSPLIIFFHGIGENGNGTTDLVNVEHWGPPQIISENLWPASRPFVVLAPQHNGTGCPAAAEISAFISFAVSHYNVDKHRIYLTGLSCGALGIDGYLAAYGSSRIAATVTVAGDADVPWQARGCAIVQTMPLWAFHGGQDETVPIDGDNDGLENLQMCTNRKDVVYTVYPDADHATTWMRAYDPQTGPDIYSWMLQYSR